MNLQVEKLQLKVDNQTTIHDVETRLGNKRKAERENDKQALASINDDIKKLKDEVAKKAPQSELDRMKEKIIQNRSSRVPPPPTDRDNNNNDNNNNNNNNTNNNFDNYTRNNYDDAGPGPTYNGEEVVLIMDSNMNLIKKGLFWKSTFKLKCGRADQLEDTLKNYDFSRAKHIFIGTGTNDPQYGQNAAQIYHNLYKSAEYLSQAGPGGPSNHLAQLPPRLDTYGSVVDDLNKLIKTDPPPNVHVMLHENTTHSNMADDKHIHTNSIRKFVGNMKDSMRKVTMERTDDKAGRSNRSGGQSRPSPHSRYNRRNEHHSGDARYNRNTHDYQYSRSNGYRGHSDQSNISGPQNDNNNFRIFGDLVQKIAMSMESNTSMLHDLKTCIHELKG